MNRILTTDQTPTDQLERINAFLDTQGLQCSPYPLPDANGLYYPYDHLKRIGLVVILLPLERMATYADDIARQRIGFKDPMHPSYIAQMKRDILSLREAQMMNLNATGIGNLAYVYLHTDDLELKEAAMGMLETVYDYVIKITYN